MSDVSKQGVVVKKDKFCPDCLSGLMPGDFCPICGKKVKPDTIDFSLGAVIVPSHKMCEGAVGDLSGPDGS